MKKLYCFIMALILAATFCSCRIFGNDGGYKGTKSSVNSSESDNDGIDTDDATAQPITRESGIGQVVSMKYGEFGQFQSDILVSFEYDSEGNISGKVYKNIDGTLRGKYKYEYDARGNKIKNTFILGASIVEGSDKDVVDEVRKYEYDKNNYLVKEYYYSRNGEFLSSEDPGDDELASTSVFSYKFDEDGRMVESCRMHESQSDGYSNTDKYTYEYDPAGRRIKKTGKFGYTEYTYDDSGNLIKEIWYDSTDNSMGDVYTYEYDEYNNLTGFCQFHGDDCEKDPKYMDNPDNAVDCRYYEYDYTKTSANRLWFDYDSHSE